MRKSFIAGALLFAAGPSLAQAPTVAPPVQPPVYDEEARYDGPLRDEMEEAVADPRRIAEMGAAMDRLVGAVMDLPIGGIAQAVDPYNRGGYRRGDTVRDMASRDDPYVEERLRAGIHGSTRSIGAMTQALARMMPVFQQSIREVERSVEQALDESRYDRRDRRYERRDDGRR